MSTITLDVPENIANSATRIAQRTHQRVEDVLLAWLDQVATELPVDELSDEQVLALSQSQLSASQQQELSDLLAENREGLLSPQSKLRLDHLMTLYRRALVRKADAIKVAVERGLQPPLH